MHSRLFLNRASFILLHAEGGMFDPDLFGHGSLEHTNTVFTTLRLLRICAVVYVLYWLLIKSKYRLTPDKIKSYLCIAFFLWLGGYLFLLCEFIPTIAEDKSVLHVLSSFSWFENFCWFINAEFSNSSYYLIQIPNAVSILDNILQCASDYTYYCNCSNADSVELDKLILRLLYIFIALLPFFTIVDWLLLTAKVLFLLPVFFLLPPQWGDFEVVDSELGYRLYNWRGILLLLQFLSSLADGCVDNNLYDLRGDKIVIIEFLLHWVYSFIHVLAY